MYSRLCFFVQQSFEIRECIWHVKIKNIILVSVAEFHQSKLRIWIVKLTLKIIQHKVLTTIYKFTGPSCLTWFLWRKMIISRKHMYKSMKKANREGINWVIAKGKVSKCIKSSFAGLNVVLPEKYICEECNLIDGAKQLIAFPDSPSNRLHQLKAMHLHPYTYIHTHTHHIYIYTHTNTHMRTYMYSPIYTDRQKMNRTMSVVTIAVVRCLMSVYKQSRLSVHVYVLMFDRHFSVVAAGRDLSGKASMPSPYYYCSTHSVSLAFRQKHKAIFRKVVFDQKWFHLMMNRHVEMISGQLLILIISLHFFRSK